MNITKKPPPSTTKKPPSSNKQKPSSKNVRKRKNPELQSADSAANYNDNTSLLDKLRSNIRRMQTSQRQRQTVKNAVAQCLPWAMERSSGSTSSMPPTAFDFLEKLDNGKGALLNKALKDISGPYRVQQFLVKHSKDTIIDALFRRDFVASLVHAQQNS